MFVGDIRDTLPAVGLRLGHIEFGQGRFAGNIVRPALVLILGKVRIPQHFPGLAFRTQPDIGAACPTKFLSHAKPLPAPLTLSAAKSG